MMFRDYEKTKSELNYTNKSKEDVLREVDHLKNQNRLYENKVHEQSMEQDRLRQQFTDKQALDAREILQLNTVAQDAREQIIELTRKNNEANEMLALAHREASSWKEVV